MHSSSLILHRHGKSRGVALIAALGFVAALFILISAMNYALLNRLNQAHRQQQDRQLLEIARAAALDFGMDGQADLELDDYEVKFLSAADDSAVAGSAGTEFVVVVQNDREALRTVWRRATEDTLETRSSRFVLADQRRIAPQRGEN